jgi:hypothetical protein
MGDPIMLTNARIGERDTIDVAHGYDGDVKEKSLV